MADKAALSGFSLPADATTPAGSVRKAQLDAVQRSPTFQARATAVQTLSSTASTWTPVALDTEDFDDENGHSITANTARFVAPVTRRYRVSASVIFDTGQAFTTGSSGNAQRGFRVMRNTGVALPGVAAFGVYAGLYLTLAGSPVVVALDAGQWLELQAFGALASTRLFAASDSGSVFSVVAVS